MLLLEEFGVDLNGEFLSRIFGETAVNRFGPISQNQSQKSVQLVSRRGEPVGESLIR